MAVPVRHVIQGFDVATYVSAPGTDGQILTGRYQRVELTVNEDIEEYLETQEQIAELLDGIFTFDGTLSRGWQDLALLNKFTGKASMQRGDRISTPRFTVTAKVEAPDKTSMNGAAIKLLDCRFTSMAFAVAAGKGVVDWNLRFRGSGIQQQ